MERMSFGAERFDRRRIERDPREYDGPTAAEFLDKPARCHWLMLEEYQLDQICGDRFYAGLSDRYAFRGTVHELRTALARGRYRP